MNILGDREEKRLINQYQNMQLVQREDEQPDVFLKMMPLVQIRMEPMFLLRVLPTILLAHPLEHLPHEEFLVALEI